MITSSELRRRMEPTGQPTMHSGSRHWPAGGRHQIFVEAQSFANQPRHAVVRVGAGAHALHRSACIFPDRAPAGSALPSAPAPGTESSGIAVGRRQALPVLLLRARCATRFQALRDGRETRCIIAVEIFGADAHHFHVIERRAGRGARGHRPAARFRRNTRRGPDRRAPDRRPDAPRPLSRSRCAPGKKLSAASPWRQITSPLRVAHQLDTFCAASR